MELTTITSVVDAPTITVDRIECLGQSRDSFDVVCYDLPPTADVDGVLGLNFFEGTELRLNFKTGMITLKR